MNSGLFPPCFPADLALAAFATANEAAWPPEVAPVVVQWLGTHGYAAIGTELWLLQNGSIQSLPLGSSGVLEVHGNTVNRRTEETWDSFVARAAAETRAYLSSFNRCEIAEDGQVYFNVVWTSEADYAQLS